MSFWNTLSSWGTFFRFLLLIMAISIIVTGLFTLTPLRELAFGPDGVSMKWGETEESAGKFTRMIARHDMIEFGDASGKNRVLALLMPASEMWYDTGVDIEPGETVRILASGTVSMSIGNTVDQVRDERSVDLLRSYLRHPSGHPVGSNVQRRIDELRRDLLVSPSADFGRLLACLHTVDAPRPGPDLPRPDAIVEVGADGSLSLRSTSTSPARLMLCVNDLVVSSDPTDAERWLGQVGEYKDPKSAEYLGMIANSYAIENVNRGDPLASKPAIEQFIEVRLKARWQAAAEARTPDHFFHDNVGVYRVTLWISKT